ncbi:ABC transporter ATP-binding protein [Microbacterium amylolyticum]|uniref:ABC transport system ATP-binding protein n=1 Tax=Microbacterium amylolyticum TaxID=936337 RepID=A0ABS4ZIZ1_9MICO|nr:ABC transporter ATP-binding protein [Microbacterium amylolyticum]MBP2437260.1 putative ABC transport system ATP-binding protein [Microbacterium amylolyticum]
MTDYLLEAHDVRRVFGSGQTRFEALQGVTVQIAEGDSLAIAGESGSGKSTLLHILGALDRPDAGEVRYDGAALSEMSTSQTDALRNREFGFVFQQFYLDERATVLENVALPMTIAGVPRTQRRERVHEALKRLGMQERIDERAGRLSGGQRQRIAIARALAGRPRVLFADEPTGALDTENGEAVTKFLFELNEQDGITLILVTHSRDLADRCARRITISDGQLLHDDALHTTTEGAAL